MWWGLLWIFGIYGACIGILHAIHARYKAKGKRQPVTVVALVTRNNEAQIEWYLRSLLFFSWLRGRLVSIVIIDEGSEDGTLWMIERFARAHVHADIRVADGDLEDYIQRYEPERILVHRLSSLGNERGLPVLQF